MRRSLKKLHLMHWTIANTTVVNTSVACFTGKGSHAQRRSSSSVEGPASVRLSGSPRGIKGSLQGSHVTGGPSEQSRPSSGHVSSSD
jgi:hypothetical protein